MRFISAPASASEDIQTTGQKRRLCSHPGWAWLSYLRRFPLDRLKIDRAFMRGIATEPAAKALVSGIISLARSLGLASIAEGVETIEQLRFLEEKGCAEFQGFLYSPAVSASECGALIRAAKLGTVLIPAASDEEISAPS